MSTTTPTVLRRICDRKREEIAERKRQTTVAELMARAEAQSAPRGFIDALQQRVRTRTHPLLQRIDKSARCTLRFSSSHQLSNRRLSLALSDFLSLAIANTS